MRIAAELIALLMENARQRKHIAAAVEQATQQAAQLSILVEQDFILPKENVLIAVRILNL